MKKAQVSTEFLVMVSLMILILIVSVSIYSLFVEQGTQIKENLEATQRCLQVSSSINSFASLRGNSSYTFNISNTLNGNNYTIRMAAVSSQVRIDYGSRGISCSLETTNITNSSGAAIFVIEKNATIRNSNGVLKIEP